MVPDITDSEDRFEEITEENDSTINPSDFMENEMEIVGEFIWNQGRL